MPQPFGQRRLEQLAAQLVAGQPEDFEHPPHGRWIVGDFRPGALGGRRGQWTVQKPQGSFVMVTAGGANTCLPLSVLVFQQVPTRSTRKDPHLI